MVEQVIPDAWKPVKLAERCEAASGPDRELEVAIEWAVGDVPADAFNVEIVPGRMTIATGAYSYHHVPAYTASLDAAIALVPEGMTWDVDEGPSHWILIGKQKPAGRAQVSRIGDYINSVTGELAEVSEHGFAATPALALCAAALRARAQASSDTAKSEGEV